MTRSAPCKPQISLRATSAHPAPPPPPSWLQHYYPPPPPHPSIHCLLLRGGCGQLMTLIGLLPPAGGEATSAKKKKKRRSSQSVYTFIQSAFDRRACTRTCVDADAFRRVLLPELHYQPFGKKLALIILAASLSLSLSSGRRHKCGDRISSRFCSPVYPVPAN